MRAGGWTLFGYGTNQVLRLGGNLILTRLLFPEAFGMMAVVQAVMTGVAMLSDLGIEQSIIQNKRGHEPTFVNTAWSLQIVRGLLIWIALWLLREPIAAFCHEPMLAELLPVIGLTAIIAGFGSMKIAMAGRSLGLAKVTMIEVGSYALGLIVMIVWAWLDRSIWALVGGSIVGALAKTIASHVSLDGIAHRFAWERRSFGELMTFGHWIFISSALTFFAGEGNRLLIGNLLDVRTLSFFTLAMTMNQFPQQIVQQMASRVLFPAYSEIVRERPDRLYAVIAKSRLLQIVPYWLTCAAFVYFGDHLMHFLYDERYRDSGWMLQLLALGSLVSSLAISYSGVLWAKGLVRQSTVLLALQLMIQIPALVFGAYAGGAKGLVLAVAASGWLIYPIYAIAFARIGLWQPKIDLPFIGLSIVIAAFSLKTGGYFG